LQLHRFLVNRANLAAQILFFAATIINTGPCGAAANKPSEPEFRAIYDQFLSAVRANDKSQIADLIAFPVSAWAVKGKAVPMKLPSQTELSSCRNMSHFLRLLCGRMP
jgi:hypothetical protein